MGGRGPWKRPSGLSTQPMREAAWLIIISTKGILFGGTFKKHIKMVQLVNISKIHRLNMPEWGQTYYRHLEFYHAPL